MPNSRQKAAARSATPGSAVARFILALIVFAMAIIVLKIVIVAIIIAGLVFRTKETIGLLLLLGAWALFKAYPAAFLALGGAAILIVLVRWLTAKGDKADGEQLTLPLDDTTT